MSDYIFYNYTLNCKFVNIKLQGREAEIYTIVRKSLLSPDMGSYASGVNNATLL